MNEAPFFKDTSIKKFVLIESNMEIPHDSYVRTWIDRQGMPYKYEFRGSKYQGYHNPNELIVERKYA